MKDAGGRYEGGRPSALIDGSPMRPTHTRARPPVHTRLRKPSSCSRLCGLRVPSTLTRACNCVDRVEPRRAGEQQQCGTARGAPFRNFASQRRRGVDPIRSCGGGASRDATADHTRAIRPRRILHIILVLETTKLADTATGIDESMYRDGLKRHALVSSHIQQNPSLPSQIRLPLLHVTLVAIGLVVTGNSIDCA